MIDTVVEAARQSASEAERELARWCDALSAEVNRLKEECRLVPVHEDLPRVSEEVLVLLHDGDFDVAYRFGRLGIWHARERVYEDFEVTHWMRLPKPTSS